MNRIFFPTCQEPAWEKSAPGAGRGHPRGRTRWPTWAVGGWSEEGCSRRTRPRRGARGRRGRPIVFQIPTIVTTANSSPRGASTWALWRPARKRRRRHSRSRSSLIPCMFSAGGESAAVITHSHATRKHASGIPTGFHDPAARRSTGVPPTTPASHSTCSSFQFLEHTGTISGTPD
jgi:hypothetical protein